VAAPSYFTWPSRRWCGCCTGSGPWEDWAKDRGFERESRDGGTGGRCGGRKKAVVATTIGNFVEWDDFVVYGFFATVIGAQFFPSDEPLASIMSAFAVFGVSFVVCPLGASGRGQLRRQDGTSRYPGCRRVADVGSDVSDRGGADLRTGGRPGAHHPGLRTHCKGSRPAASSVGRPRS